MKITLLNCIKKDNNIIERWTTLNWKIPPNTHEGYVEFINHIKMSCEYNKPSCILNNLKILKKYYYNNKLSQHSYFYYKLWQRDSFEMCLLNDGRTCHDSNWPYSDDVELNGLIYHFCNMDNPVEKHDYFLGKKYGQQQHYIAYTYNKELQENVAFTKNELKYLLKFNNHIRNQVLIYFQNIHAMLEWLQRNAEYNPKETIDDYDYSQLHISEKAIYDFYSIYPKENIQEFLLTHYLVFCRVIIPLYNLGLTFKLEEKSDIWACPFKYANKNKQNIFQTAEEMYNELINEYYVET